MGSCLFYFRKCVGMEFTCLRYGQIFCSGSSRRLNSFGRKLGRLVLGYKPKPPAIHITGGF